MNVLLNVYIYTLRKKSAPLLPESKIYTPDAIANSQSTPTKINKNGAIVKLRVLEEI